MKDPGLRYATTGLLADLERIRAGQARHRPCPARPRRRGRRPALVRSRSRSCWPACSWS
ncbi:MAG: hypothetical protein R3F30_10670 [Planctomycetota bacterium]